MEKIYLSDAYLRAIKREINHRLQAHFLHFTYCWDTTYFNDECGSFEFTVNNLHFQIYTPSQLGEEVYTLFLLPNERPLRRANNLTDIFDSIQDCFKYK
jgi:hypothetical protein